jgi:hypothetical protein
MFALLTRQGQRSVLIQGDGVILNFSARSQQVCIPYLVLVGMFICSKTFVFRQLSNDNDDLPNGNARQPTAARWGFRCAIRPLYPSALPWLADHIHRFVSFH